MTIKKGHPKVPNKGKVGNFPLNVELVHCVVIT